MDSLRRAAAPLFYLLGLAVIIAIVLLKKGMMTGTMQMFLSVVDLPLLFFGMVLGGSTLAASFGKGKPSPSLVIGIFLPLVLLFGFFAYLNFGLPFTPLS